MKERVKITTESHVAYIILEVDLFGSLFECSNNKS